MKPSRFPARYGRIVQQPPTADRVDVVELDPSKIEGAAQRGIVIGEEAPASIAAGGRVHVRRRRHASGNGNERPSERARLKLPRSRAESREKVGHHEKARRDAFVLRARRRRNSRLLRDALPGASSGARCHRPGRGKTNKLLLACGITGRPVRAANQS